MMPEPEDAPPLSLEAQLILAEVWQRSIPILPSDDETLLLYLLGALPETDCGELEESLTYHPPARQRLRAVASSLEDWQHQTLDTLLGEAVQNSLMRRYLQQVIRQLVRDADTTVHSLLQSLRKTIWQEAAPSSRFAIARSEAADVALPNAERLWIAPLHLPDTSVTMIELGPLIMQQEGFTISIGFPKLLNQASSERPYHLSLELAVTASSRQRLATIRDDGTSPTFFVPFPQPENPIDPRLLAALLSVSLLEDPA